MASSLARAASPLAASSSPTSRRCAARSESALAACRAREFSAPRSIAPPASRSA